MCPSRRKTSRFPTARPSSSPITARSTVWRKPDSRTRSTARRCAALRRFTPTNIRRRPSWSASSYIRSISKSGLLPSSSGKTSRSRTSTAPSPISFPTCLPGARSSARSLRPISATRRSTCMTRRRQARTSCLRRSWARSATSTSASSPTRPLPPPTRATRASARAFREAMLTARSVS